MYSLQDRQCCSWMVEVVPLGKPVDFVCELAYFSAFFLGVGGPPSFLVQGWFGMCLSMTWLMEVFEGCLEFADGV